MAYAGWTQLGQRVCSGSISAMCAWHGGLLISCDDYLYENTDDIWARRARIRGRLYEPSQIVQSKWGVFVATKQGMFWAQNPSERLTRIFKPEKKAVYSLAIGNKGLFCGTSQHVFLISPGGEVISELLASNSPVLSMLFDEKTANLICITEQGIVIYDVDKRRIIMHRDLGRNNEDARWDPSAHIITITRTGRVVFAYRNDLYAIDIENNALSMVVSLPSSVMAIASVKGKVIAACEGSVFKIDALLEQADKYLVGLDAKRFVDMVKEENRVFLASEDAVFVLDAGELSFKAIDKDIDLLYRYLSFEPDIILLQEKAMEYADVMPDKIREWRALLKKRALFPQVSFDIGGDNNKSVSDTGSVCCSGSYAVGPDDKTVSKNLDWQVSFEWDLADLIWDPQHTSIDARSKLTAELRDDILDDLNQTYYERRRRQLELLSNPPRELDKAITILSKIERLRADIDAMTGGFLSRFLKQNGHYNWEREFIKEVLSEKRVGK